MILSSEHTLRIREGTTLLIRSAVFGDNQQTAAILYSDVDSRSRNLRVQYGCLYGTSLHSIDCDCGVQLDKSIGRIAQEGGTLLYFRDHEAYGLGLFAKSEMVCEEHATIDAQQRVISNMIVNPLRHSVLVFAIEILRRIGVVQVETLLGTSQEKRKELERLGLSIKQMEPIPIEPGELSDFGSRELTFKRP